MVGLGGGRKRLKRRERREYYPKRVTRGNEGGKQDEEWIAVKKGDCNTGDTTAQGDTTLEGVLRKEGGKRKKVGLE